MSEVIFQRNRVFRDPVHGLINISPKESFLTELINTPEFQRLHRVRQLGVGSLTFPGADHSRFSHSLGVMYIAGRVLDILKNRYPDSSVSNLIDKFGLAVKAAALLHDVGHGPFSHLIERAFGTHGDHERRTIEMILHKDGALSRELIRDGIDPLDVAQIIEHNFPVLFLQDIVTSSLDADRMDYLIRDSKYCGVEYGVYDLEWVLNCVCIGSYSAVENITQNPKQWRLCLDEHRGLQAAEQLILARKHMSLQVYYHRSTRRWEAVFLCLIKEAVRLVNEGDLPSNTSPLLITYLEKKGNISYEEFLNMDEPLMLSAFATWRNSKLPQHAWLAELAQGFLERKKVIEPVGVIPENLATHTEDILYEKISEVLGEQNSSKWEFDRVGFRAYKGPDPSIKFTDLDGYQQEVLENSILLSNGDPKINSKPVAEVSDIFRALATEKHSLRRIFCAPSIRGTIERILRDVLESNQLNLPFT